MIASFQVLANDFAIVTVVMLGTVMSSHNNIGPSGFLALATQLTSATALTALRLRSFRALFVFASIAA